MTELSSLQMTILDGVGRCKPNEMYVKIRNGVDSVAIRELEKMDKPFFAEAVRRALETTSSGLMFLKVWQQQYL